MFKAYSLLLIYFLCPGCEIHAVDFFNLNFILQTVLEFDLSVIPSKNILFTWIIICNFKFWDKSSKTFFSSRYAFLLRFTRCFNQFHWRKFSWCRERRWIFKLIVRWSLYTHIFWPGNWLKGVFNTSKLFIFNESKFLFQNIRYITKTLFLL